jgi:hypothetical protein
MFLFEDNFDNFDMFVVVLALDYDNYSSFVLFLKI